MILFHTQGALANHPQKGFIQKLIGADVETHSQPLGGKEVENKFYNSEGSVHHENLAHQNN